MTETATEIVVRLVEADPSITVSALQQATGVSRQRVHQILRAKGLTAAPNPAVPRIEPRSGSMENICTSAVGSVSELLVAADLVARGWSVFFPLFRARCDLIASSWDAGVVRRFEVRSGKRRNGTAAYQKTSNDVCDYYAIVISGEPITYEPELEIAPIKPVWRAPSTRWVDGPVLRYPSK